MLNDNLESAENSTPQNSSVEIKVDTPQDVEAKDQELQGKEANQGTAESSQQDETVVPEMYDFKSVSLPDGMELDTELTAEFSDIAKEIGLTQENADKFMGLGVKLSTKIQEKFQSVLQEHQENQIKTYETLLNTDPEIGGANLKSTLLEANIAYETFVSDEAKDLLAECGLNKHPAIVKVFRDIGKQLKDDSISNKGKSTHERDANDWYPEMRKN